MGEVGSTSWLDATEYDEGDELHTRATSFVASVNWDILTARASERRGSKCSLSDKFSLGHFNLVRRLVFEDGTSWIVRLRLPQLPSTFGTREALDPIVCMRIEIATMSYLRQHGDIPVPEVMGHDLDPGNEVGAPYLFMSYIHGTAASELRQIRHCELDKFGTPEQDKWFRHQMAAIQVKLAGLTFDRIGSLRQDQGTGEFSMGSEIVTGEGPWETPGEFYSALAHHRRKVAEREAEPEVQEKESFSLPSKVPELMKRLQTRTGGPYGLANRDLGAHNALVDTDFNIVGLIDFDGVIAAPVEVIAQPPCFMDLERAAPGHVETRPLAIERIERTKHLLPEYVGYLRDAARDIKLSTGDQSEAELADAMMSDGAKVVQGLEEYGMHSDLVNDRWMLAYDMLSQ